MRKLGRAAFRLTGPVILFSMLPNPVIASIASESQNRAKTRHKAAAAEPAPENAPEPQNQCQPPDEQQDTRPGKGRRFVRGLKGAGKGVGKGLGKGIKKGARAMTSNTARTIGAQAVTMATGVKVPVPATTSGQAAPAPTATKGGNTPEPAKTGTVKITCDSVEAELYVDGNLMGNTPAILKLPAGSHQVVIKAEGYAKWSRRIGILPGANLNLKATLEKK
jgi:hypothetical protein